MSGKRYVEDLTTEELRRLLMERRRQDRSARLDYFRRTGRLVSASDLPIEKPLTGSHKEISQEHVRALSPRRKLLERVLLGVEILAVLGLVVLLLSGVNLLRNLNREAASALQLPGLTPTPLITALVLPGGHTPPTSDGGALPNDAEIPEHLRPLVQSLADLPLPTSSPEQTIRIQIPAIGVDAPVVQGDGWEQLKKGVGQALGSPIPGQNGNVVLSAHNDIYGEIFRDLDRLRPGDEITLFTAQRSYTYTVRQTQVVEPTRVEVMEQTQEPIVTLISCYPYLQDDQRIVVVADLQE